MRYLPIETITFTDINGNDYPIKDIRPIEQLTTMMTININENNMIDEIASRDRVYGEGSESRAYKIYDHNIVEIVDADFDFSKIKTLRIPL